MKAATNKLTNLVLRTWGMFLNPYNEWLEISKEEENKKEVFLNYALPLIGFCSLIAFLGIYISYNNLIHALSQMLVVFISLSGGIYLAAQIIKIMAPSFGASDNENRSFILVIYSASAFCIFYAIANIFSYFSFFRQLFILFELYFIRLFWLGATPLLDVPANKKAGFTLVSGLIILIIPLIVKRMLSILFTIPYVSI